MIETAGREERREFFWDGRTKAVQFALPAQVHRRVRIGAIFSVNFDGSSESKSLEVFVAAAATPHTEAARKAWSGSSQKKQVRYTPHLARKTSVITSSHCGEHLAASGKGPSFCRSPFGTVTICCRAPRVCIRGVLLIIVYPATAVACVPLPKSLEV